MWVFDPPSPFFPLRVGLGVFLLSCGGAKIIFIFLHSTRSELFCFACSLTGFYFILLDIVPAYYLPISPNGFFFGLVW
jgi:hypothetical protein